MALFRIVHFRKPRSSCQMCCRRRSASFCTRAMTSAVSGPDPSSATMSSKSCCVCAAYPHSDFSSQAGWLYVVRITAACTLIAPHLQNRQKRFLRNLHCAHLLHALLAFLLLLEELAFAGDVAAVTLRRDVL